MHQIRVTMLHLGMPILGDHVYCTPQSTKKSVDILAMRPLLHSSNLRWRDAVVPLEVTAPFPTDLQTTLDDLRKKNTNDDYIYLGISTPFIKQDQE